MSKQWNKLDLSQKFTFIIVAFFLIPFILLFIYSNIINYNESISEKKRNLEEKELVIREQTIKTLEIANLTSEVIKGSSKITEYLNAVHMGNEISLDDKLAFYHQEIKNIEKIIISNPFLHEIKIYSDNPDIDEMYPILYGKNRAPYDFNNQYDNQWVMHKSKSEAKFENLVSLVNTQSLEDQDIAIIQVSVELSEMYPDVFKGSDFLITKMGEIIGDEDIDPFLLNEILKTQGISRIKNSKNQDYLVLNQSLDEFDVSYISIISLKDLNNMIYTRLFFTTLLTAVMGIFLIVIVRNITDQLLVEMYDIFDTIRIFSNGDLTIRPKNYNQIEMDVFSREVSAMFEKTVSLIEENVERETAEQNARIKALQSQINSHFIYNVLENIKMFAEISEVYEVSDAITSLGSLLHYSMHWDESEVCLAEEIKYVEHYLDLMILRLNYNLDVKIKIPSYLEKVKVPKLLVQPIVENAIVHGLVNQEEDTTIKLEAFDFEEKLIIQVTDYGQGMSMGELRNVKRGLNQEIDIDDKGIGLANISQRIKIIYGEKYGLDIVSDKNVFTTVILMLPLYSSEGDLNEENFNRRR